MDSEFKPINTVPALIGFLLYYFALKIWWGLPGPDWGYFNYVDTFMVNIFRAFLYTLPTVVVFFYCRSQRKKERRELHLWGQEVERRETSLKYEIRDDLEKFRKEIRALRKSIEEKQESKHEPPTKTEVIQGFNLQGFLEP